MRGLRAGGWCVVNEVLLRCHLPRRPVSHNRRIT
jgi:hypothetical protein